MPLLLQRIRIPDQELGLPDCLRAILQGYFEWGFQEDVDGPRAELTEQAERRIILRGYQVYDGCPISRDNQVTAADIGLTVSINSRVALFDVRRILAYGETISAMLQACDADLHLVNAPEDVVDSVGQTVNELCEVSHLGVGKITKILHKKRPNLIPLIDNYVRESLHKNFPWMLRGRQGTSFAKLMATFRMAQERAAPVLQETVATLHGDWGIGLTEGRALSYLIWHWRRQIKRRGRPFTLRHFWGSQGQAGLETAKTLWEQGG